MNATITEINIKTYEDLSTSIILDCKVTYILRTLGIPAHLNGYMYLKSAIIKTVEDPAYLFLITKRLYVDLAKEYGVTASKVERGMRTAIEKTEGTNSAIKIAFIGQSKDYYTNTEFITGISELIRCSRLMEENQIKAH